MSKILVPGVVPNYKHIFESLDILNGLNKNHYVSIRKPGSQFDRAVASLKKQDKGFVLSFEDQRAYHVDLGDVNDVKIITSEHLLRADKIFINHISDSTISGKLSSFYTDGFDRKAKNFFRLIVPLKKKIDFHFYISHIGYRTKKHTSASCLRIQHTDLSIDLYLYSDKENNSEYLMVDASEKIDLDQFQDYCFSTLVSYGYITGEMPQDEGYFFTYDKVDLQHPRHIHYSELRPTIKSMYAPLYADAFGYLHSKSDRTSIEEIHRTLRVLNAKEFSKLCQWAHQSLEFSSILLLIIEACSSSLLVMPSGLSVALEGLTDLLVKQNAEKVAPISSKPIAKKVREELLKVLSSNSSKISSEGLAILKRRIENINQLTNQAKLTKPFELFKFALTEEDKSAINHRNDFLHGRLTLAIEGDVKNANNEIYYVALRLYTLLAVLILKSVGYDNKIVNYPVVHNDVYNKELDEPSFRQV